MALHHMMVSALKRDPTSMNNLRISTEVYDIIEKNGRLTAMQDTEEIEGT
jgi:hypothetical protein